MRRTTNTGDLSTWGCIVEGIIFLGTIVAFIGLFSLSLYSNFAGIISAVGMAVISILFYKKVIPSSPKLKYIPWLTGFMTFFLVVSFFWNSNRNIVQAHSWFLKGEIITKAVYVEPDEETAGGYEDRYSFNPDGKVARDIYGVIDYWLLLCYVGSFFACCFIFYRLEKKDDDDNYDDRDIFFIVMQIIVASLLVLCLLEMPPWYYQVIRWVVLIACLNFCIEEQIRGGIGAYMAFVAVAILFNPIQQIYLSKITWNVIDIILAIILFTMSIKRYIDTKSS